MTTSAACAGSPLRIQIHIFWDSLKLSRFVNFYEDHETIPTNLVLVFSSWPAMSFSNPHGHRVAWMQDGTETRVPKNAISCPGNCESCGMCYELDRLARDVVFHRH